MKLISTKNSDTSADVSTAILTGLAPDGGLYMPSRLTPLPKQFFSNLSDMSLQETSLRICQHLFESCIDNSDIENIINESITFPCPLITLEKTKHVLELWHGPSLAFKDFGAQFMAQVMSHFNGSSDSLTILVATSGDTGGAVASGFHNVAGINVIILYPKGKVSKLQEKQLTTFDNNIFAIEVNGTFDDCQNLVKRCFTDPSLSKNLRLTSANSINIARLIPQMFYYFEGYKQIYQLKDLPIVFSVPSGNFGNLTAGLMARQLGLPIHHFIASTNINDVVPEYLKTKNYVPKPSKETISNAMDVGSPSNFERIMHLYGSTWNNVTQHISGYSFTDEQTIQSIKDCHDQYNYQIDPHGAVALLGLESYHKQNPDTIGIILETAHPSKFKQTMDSALNTDIPIHPKLANLEFIDGTKTRIENNYPSLINAIETLLPN